MNYIDNIRIYLLNASVCLHCLMREHPTIRVKATHLHFWYDSFNPDTKTSPLSQVNFQGRIWYTGSANRISFHYSFSRHWPGFIIECYKFLSRMLRVESDRYSNLKSLYPCLSTLFKHSQDWILNYFYFLSFSFDSSILREAL